MRRPHSIALVTFAVAALIMVGWYLAMIGTATPASAATYCTSAYASVQAAINAAGDGDTVRVVYGTHYENLDITDDIKVEGGWNKGCADRTYTDPQYTVIDGGAADHVVEITGTSTVTLDGLTVTNGFAQKGGGVYVSGASADLNDVIVTSNVISPSGSGGFDPTHWAYGAGVYVEDGTIALKDCEITDNTSYPGATEISFGGGLALNWVLAGGATAVIEGTEIMSNTNNSSSVLYGGGLFLDGGGVQVTFVGTDNLVAYNEASAGGGVYMYGDVVLEGVLIKQNVVSINGGGIYLASGYHGGRIANNYLVDNNASQKGPSIAAVDASTEIANNTIVGDLTSSGAGIAVIDAATGVLELTNNIVVNHAIGIRRWDSASVTLSHNDVWSNTTNYVGLSAGSGDISLDPEFVNPGNDDYHLESDSPCIDVGDYVEGLYFDYDGDRRTGMFLDIGADEYPAEYLCFVPGVLKAFTP